MSTREALLNLLDKLLVDEDEQCDENVEHNDKENCDACNEPDHCPPHPREECGTEVIVDGVLGVPECKPDIESILRFSARCHVTHWDHVDTKHGRKVVVTGLVDIHIEYVAEKLDQPMHFVEFTVPFHTFFLCKEPVKSICCGVEFTHYELLDSRTISKVILLNVEGVS
jgi:hypothetical protein